jgi:hypothetical protein
MPTAGTGGRPAGTSTRAILSLSVVHWGHVRATLVALRPCSWLLTPEGGDFPESHP